MIHDIIATKVASRHTRWHRLTIGTIETEQSRDGNFPKLCSVAAKELRGNDEHRREAHDREASSLRASRPILQGAACVPIQQERGVANGECGLRDEHTITRQSTKRAPADGVAGMANHGDGSVDENYVSLNAAFTVVAPTLPREFYLPSVKLRAVGI